MTDKGKSTKEITKRKTKRTRRLANKTNDVNFDRWMLPILKHTDGGKDMSLTSDTATILTGMTVFLTRSIAKEAGAATRRNKKVTIGVREVTTAVRSVIPRADGTEDVSTIDACLNEVNLAVARFNKYQKEHPKPTKERPSTGKKTSVKLGTKGGVVLPVARIGKLLRLHSGIKRVGPRACIAAAAAVEYVLSILFEEGIKAAQHNDRQRIQARHLHMVIQNDDDLRKLLGKGAIAGSGVLPPLRASRAQKNTPADKEKEVSEDEEEEEPASSKKTVAEKAPKSKSSKAKA